MKKITLKSWGHTYKSAHISVGLCLKLLKGEFQICPRMDLDNILYVEYLRYNNYKNEIILFLERC